MIVRFNEAFKVTMVVVSHDVKSAMRTADRIVMIGDGEVFAEGTVDEIRNSPDKDVQRFLEGKPDNEEREFLSSMENVRRQLENERKKGR